MEIVTLCTGNAARSVMAGALLKEHVSGARIVTSGTHVPEFEYADAQGPDDQMTARLDVRT